jgi:glycerol-3-phosphate O-acyltransferase / dihydroxyacetone phosphate acyltransferase
MSELAVAPGKIENVRRPSGLFRSGLVWTFRRIIGIYFRAIETAGNTPAADTGGRLFVANHVNALVDPILVLTAAPCPISPVAKSTLWKIPGLRWLLTAADAVPIVRRRDDPTKASGGNEEVFDKIAAWLAGGQNILIFPEGTSHSEPHLIAVKSGAARMIARARESGGRGLTLQAVALEFDERHVFRSRCLMLYGPVREVDAFVEEGDALVAALTERLREDLSELLVEGATWPEKLRIARIAEMLANDTGDRSLVRWNSIGRDVEAALKTLREGGKATEASATVGAAVDHYYDLLAREGLDDAQLALGDAPRGSLLKAAWLVLLLPLAALGIVLYALPYRLPTLAARRVAKSEGDEISTYKLGVGILVYPIWVALWITLAVVFLPGWLAAVSATAVVSSPFAALAWLDRTPALRRSLRLRARAQRLAELRAERAEVMRLVEQYRPA